MQPTDILMTEHRLIEQVLNCLEKIVQQAEAEKQLEKKSALEVIDFCRALAEGCHHAKEEAHLFPAMEANGFSGGCSPVAVMQREHELGRLYIQGMAAAVEAAALGEPVALMWFVQHGKSYVKLLREHIHKEDSCLFPAANHRLTLDPPCARRGPRQHRGTVTMLGAVVNVNSAQWRDTNDAPISRAAFFQGANVGTVVRTKGNNPNASPLVAGDAELEN